MDIPNITPEGLVGTLVTALASFLGAKRLYSTEKVKSAVDDTSIVATVAQAALIESLQNELERIATNFGRVLKELEKSHADNLKLREANLVLLDRVAELHDTQNKMQEQLNKMERRRQECSDYQFDDGCKQS